MESEKKDSIEETPPDPTVIFDGPAENLEEISVQDRQQRIRDITKASRAGMLERLEEKTKGVMDNLDAVAGVVYMKSVFIAGYLMHSGKSEAWLILAFAIFTGLVKQKIAVGPIMKILQRDREKNRTLFEAVKNTIKIE